MFNEKMASVKLFTKVRTTKKFFMYTSTEILDVWPNILCLESRNNAYILITLGERNSNFVKCVAYSDHHMAQLT